MRRIFGLILIAIAIIGAFFGWKAYDRYFGEPDINTIMSSSLAGIKEQNVLVPFTARFVAVVTSTENIYGFDAQKTLILPGIVRYELNLGALEQKDLSWNSDSQTLTITLPKMTIADEVEMDKMREFRDGEFILALTNAEARLDDANQKAARQQIMTQAKEDSPMNMAKRAAEQAIGRSFAMPLKAAGIDAKVTLKWQE